jgi:DNA polymerase-4
MARTILHLDLDAFFCAVEMQRDPALIGLAFAVGARPDRRGVVASCSYPARRYGVRSAMPMSRALQLCPQLVIVSHHFADYHAMSKQVMQRLHDLSPLVEQLSIDEAFLDVTGIRTAPHELAASLQARINRELDVPCSLGVATNKLVAKIANNMGKAGARGDSPPNAIKVVPPGEEAAFLAPLPVAELFGVGPRTAERLARLRVKTIGDLARIPEGQLVQMFGKFGHELAQRSRGIDDRPVEPESVRKSLGRETTFVRDVRDGNALKHTLRRQSDHVAWQLRRHSLRGTTVRLKLRWADFTTLTRQLTLDHATDDEDQLYESAVALFEQTWIPGKAVRLIGVTVAGFDHAADQLSLFERPRDARHEKLHRALDDIRERFGEDSIKRGSIIGDERDVDA